MLYEISHKRYCQYCTSGIQRCTVRHIVAHRDYIRRRHVLACDEQDGMKETRAAMNYVSFQDVLAEDLQDPSERAEWDRLQLARDVAVWLLAYRKKHRLTQTQLARQLDWPQSVIARLESGDREPSIATLHRLVERLGATATIAIRPERVEVRFGRPRRSAAASAGGRA